MAPTTEKRRVPALRLVMAQRTEKLRVPALRLVMAQRTEKLRVLVEVRMSVTMA